MVFKRTMLSHAVWMLMLIHLGECNSSFHTEDSDKQIRLNDQDFDYVDRIFPIIPKCELVYQEYLKAIENFTHCEIHHVRPFKLCLHCREHYQVAADLYSELNSNPQHEACKTKYMMSDIVQIIPTVQTNMNKMWRKSHCHRCYSHNDTMRERVSKFLTLYSNFSICINASVENDMIMTWTSSEDISNNSSPCIRCKSQYVALNANFNAMYRADSGDVCMDIMDMMNYTRIMWSSQLNCTSSSYDSTPVIVISSVVACIPVFFYVYLRITGKVRRAKLYQPKRLTTSTSISSRSHSTTDSSHSSG